MQDKLINAIALLPKAEIHVHGEAIASFSTYHKLNQRYKIDRSFKSENDYKKLLKINNLEEMLKNYFFLQSFFRSPEDFSSLAEDVITYAKRNKIQYMEVFLSPSMVLRLGFVDFVDFLKPIVEVFSREYTETGLDIRILIDISRSFGYENALQNYTLMVDFLKRYPTDRVIGIGLGGQEIDHSCKDYKDVFLAAKEAGFHRVVHAGEEVGPESIWDAIKYLDAERIGHGTSAIYDFKLVDYLKEHQIPLEICPKSNIITRKFVSQYCDHPIYQYYKNGLLVTLNTDDPILFDIELNQEYANLASCGNFSWKDLVVIAENTVTASFAPVETRQAIIASIKKVAHDTKVI